MNPYASLLGFAVPKYCLQPKRLAYGSISPLCPMIPAPASLRSDAAGIEVHPGMVFSVNPCRTVYMAGRGGVPAGAGGLVGWRCVCQGFAKFVQLGEMLSRSHGAAALRSKHSGHNCATVAGSSTKHGGARAAQGERR